MIHYIDPGTGSMLFTILIGVISAGIYAIRNLGIKLRFVLSGGKAKEGTGDAESIPFVVISDDKRYWPLFRPICRIMETKGQKIVYMTASEDDPALEEVKTWGFVKAEYTGEGNKSYAAWNKLKADIVLSTTPSLDVFQWKRSKDVKYYIHIPHAASDITMYRMFGIDYYDAVLLTGEFQVEQIRALEQVRKLPAKELAVVGFPLFDEMSKKLKLEDIRKVQSAAADRDDYRRTVLLAPSWGASSLWNKYGSRIIDELLKTDYNIIIRPHPQSFKSETKMIEEIMAKYPDSERLSWDRNPDNFPSLNRADILISDFSGVIFDFAVLFDKPVIYTDTEYDKAPYDACWLDEELWTFRVLPAIGEMLTEENLGKMQELVEMCINDPRYSAGRNLARKQCWSNKGKSADRIADYMIKKRKQLQEMGENNIQ